MSHMYLDFIMFCFWSKVKYHQYLKCLYYNFYYRSDYNPETLKPHALISSYIW